MIEDAMWGKVRGEALHSPRTTTGAVAQGVRE